MKEPSLLSNVGRIGVLGWGPKNNACVFIRLSLYAYLLLVWTMKPVNLNLKTPRGNTTPI